MRQWAEVRTSTAEETDIGRHLDEHAVVRHLVAIATWEPAGVSDIWVGRTDDRPRLRSGIDIDQASGSHPRSAAFSCAGRQGALPVPPR
jgi:hypothetical protein